MADGKTIAEILDIIDDIIPIYEKHKNTIRLMFGGFSVSQAGDVIKTIKGFFGK